MPSRIKLILLAFLPLFLSCDRQEPIIKFNSPTPFEFFDINDTVIISVEIQDKHNLGESDLWITKKNDDNKVFNWAFNSKETPFLIEESIILKDISEGEYVLYVDCADSRGNKSARQQNFHIH